MYLSGVRLMSTHKNKTGAYVVRMIGVLMLGMNPGPWGMAQTGVPFGEIPAVRDWMGGGENVRTKDAFVLHQPIETFISMMIADAHGDIRPFSLLNKANNKHHNPAVMTIWLNVIKARSCFRYIKRTIFYIE